jgi:hypothetical protein
VGRIFPDWEREPGINGVQPDDPWWMHWALNRGLRLNVWMSLVFIGLAVVVCVAMLVVLFVLRLT